MWLKGTSYIKYFTSEKNLTHPSPTDHALSHLAKLAAAGTNPGRMARETKTIIDGWRGSDPDHVQEWMASLREYIGFGLGDAVEQAESVDASEGAGAAKHAQAVVEALRAALEVIEGGLVGA